MPYRTTRLWGMPTSDYSAARSGSGSPLRRLLIRGSLHPIIIDYLSRLLHAGCVYACAPCFPALYRISKLPSLLLLAIALNKVVYYSLASIFLVGSQKPTSLLLPIRQF